MKKTIRLSQFEDVKNFVLAAGKCNFDVEILNNKNVIDAKSILSVLSLDLSENLTVEYDGYNDSFEEAIKAYSAA
ncbi:MAG: HPr family phosphocarrier protein [Lachnospiraceae bacterium]|nr:HPr family phosphocarrier protein [Lachnospiraceae bacterium]